MTRKIFKKKTQDEFQEELPFEDLDDKGLLDAKTPRRDFLKYLGFSTAAAAHCCQLRNAGYVKHYSLCQQTGESYSRCC